MADDEEWRPVPEYEGLYEVSNLGRVYSRRAGRQMKSTRSGRYGHQVVNLQLRGQRRTFGVHQLVLLAFVGPCPEGMQIRHLNGDPTNNRLGNLRYGTPSENALDRVAHGTDPYARRARCKRGHEYTPENTFYQPRKPNARWCRECHRENSLASYHRRRGAA